MKYQARANAEKDSLTKDELVIIVTHYQDDNQHWYRFKSDGSKLREVNMRLVVRMRDPGNRRIWAP